MSFLNFAEQNILKFWPCPTCLTPIEKNDGCNHMTCTKCDQHFCWVCKKALESDKYRDHFADINGRGYRPVANR